MTKTIPPNPKTLKAVLEEEERVYREIKEEFDRKGLQEHVDYVAYRMSGITLDLGGCRRYYGVIAFYMDRENCAVRCMARFMFSCQVEWFGWLFKKRLLRLRPKRVYRENCWFVTWYPGWSELLLNWLFNKTTVLGRL